MNPSKDQKNTNLFVYFYEGMPTKEEVASQVENHKKVSISAESKPVNIELHSDAKLQNEENTHFDSKISTHERDDEILERDVHSDSEAKRSTMERRTEPRLSKYVRRHHPIEQIIGNKDVRPMTRNTLRNESCILSQIKPKTLEMH